MLLTSWRIPSLTALILFLVTTASRADNGDLDYVVSTISLGDVAHHSAIPLAARDRGSSDLVVITVDLNGKRELLVYQSLDGRYQQPAHRRELDADIVLMDSGVIAGEEVLVGFTRGTAFRFDPYTGRRQQLAQITSLYAAPVFNQVPHLDLVRDLNGDGHDDLLIPGFDGYSVFVQSAAGDFTAPVQTDSPPMVDMSYESYPWYQPRQVYLADVSQDGRDDVVFWDQGALLYYPQSEFSPQFAVEGVRVDTGLSVDFAGFDELSTAMRDQDQSDSTARAMYQVADQTGDGVVDLLVLTVVSEGVFKKSSRFELHRGRLSDGLLRFSSEPDTVIDSKGLQFETLTGDFNNDGQQDLVVSTIELGFGKVLGALITGSVKIDLNFYQMRDGEYPRRPDMKRNITARIDMGAGDFFLPTVLLADADNDGFVDLLVQDGDDTLEIYRGGVGNGLFARDPVAIEVDMPGDPELVDLSDLNGDGRMDLVIRHTPTVGERRVVIMVSSE